MFARHKRLFAAVAVLSAVFALYQNFDRVPGISRIVELPLGLKATQLKLPANEFLDPAMVELGNLLFFDKRLSKGGVMSCATCHQPARGYATTGISKGVAGNTLARTTPPAVNRAFGSENDWLGSKTLEGQSTAPITAADEMGLTAAQVLTVVNSIPGYKDRFDRLVAAKRIAAPGVSMANIGLVIATFQRSLMSANSRVDQYEAGVTSALNATELAGRTLFLGAGRCVVCHSGSNYTDELYHNIASGCPSGGGACRRPTASTTDPEAGRWNVTRNAADVGKFKTPSLRNVALRPPYFHGGIDKDLKTVVHGYNVAGNLDTVIGQDPILVNLGLTSVQEDQLVAFMTALTGEIPLNAALSVEGNAASPATREQILLSPEIFDLAVYKSLYADVASLTDEQVKAHWINTGLSAGRKASRTFSAAEYLQLYSDLGTTMVGANRYRDAALHFLASGKMEGRVGRHALTPAFFNSVDYRNLNSARGIGMYSHEKAIVYHLTTGIGLKLPTHAKPKGFFSVGTAFYYADFGYVCTFASAAAFNASYGRTDGLGYPRLPYLPPNIVSQGTCPAATGAPPVLEKFLAGEAFSAAKIPYALKGDLVAEVPGYAAATGVKALAIAANGYGYIGRQRSTAASIGAPKTQAEATRMALEGCQVMSSNQPCMIFAEGNVIKYKYSDFVKSGKRVLESGARSVNAATVPWQSDAVRTQRIPSYIADTNPYRVLALGIDGSGSYKSMKTNQAENIRMARESCEGYGRGRPCTVYALANAVQFNVSSMNYNMTPALDYSRTDFAGSAVPFVSDAARAELAAKYPTFVKSYPNSVIVLHVDGSWAYNSSESAALTTCKQYTATACFVYARGLRVTFTKAMLNRDF